jgi:hypothetical protein
VLDGLGYQLGPWPVTVIWDSLARTTPRICAPWRRPSRGWGGGVPAGDAPELNPVEGLWANLKGSELANRCCDTRKERIAPAEVGSIRARRDPDLLLSFLTRTDLTL